MLGKPRRVALVVAAVALAVFAGRVIWGRALPAIELPDFGPGLAFFSAFAMVCAVLAGLRARGPQRVAWTCLAAGLAGMAGGDVIRAYVYLATGSRLPFPSPVDLLYLLLPVCMVMAAVFTPLVGVRAGLRLILDGVIVSASLFIVAWSVGLDDIYRASNEVFLGFLLAVTFPVADVALLTMVVVVLFKAPPANRPSLGLLAGGLLAITITNCAVIYFDLWPPQVDGRVVLGWALGMYLVGAAGLTSKPSARPIAKLPRTPTRSVSWLPYVPVPFAIAMVIVNLWPYGSAAPILVGGLILILAALLRQFTLLRENYRLRATVADIALRDRLTGLGNRTLFADRLSHAMQLRLRNAAPVAVLLLDLDDFRLVNDSLGHVVGDALLRDVGDRIQGAVRPGDTVSRLGGDEFAILVEDAPAVAEQIAERVVRAFDEPFTVDDGTVDVRLSIGLATVVGDAEVSAEELFKRADLAMYSAKRAHVGTRSFTPDMGTDATELDLPSRQHATGRPNGISRIQFLGDLRHAIEHRTLDLLYQPKFSLRTRTIAGVEALIRWPHPEYGLLEPADFLPLVRENGLMETMSDLVLVRAARDAAGWWEAGVELPVAINLSAPSLNDEALPDRVLSVLAEFGMSPASLTVEITEDLLLASVVRARSVLDRLRESGVRVAIDDFGSGYAAMTYLHELPVDELKLDRQFVAPILHDERAAAIVRSVLELAHEFGLASVAEGVEDKGTADLLASWNCDFGQGLYFSAPLPAQVIKLGIGLAAHGGGGVTPTEEARPSWA